MWFDKRRFFLFLIVPVLIVMAGCGAVTEKKQNKAGKFKVTDAVAVNRAQYDRLSPQAKVSFDTAIIAIQKGENNVAESLLKKVSKGNPDFLSASTNLGIIYFKTGRLPEAEGILKSLIKKNANNVVAYNYLGMVYRQEGKFKEAEKTYKDAIALNPDYANAHLNLGILFDLYLQDIPKALDSYSRYQALTKKQKGKEDKEVVKWIFDLKGRKK